MTHDPNVLNALYFSLDGRFFKLRADRFFLARYLFQFYACSARSRKLVGLVPFYLWSISRVGVS
jgi:hypothetical protein